MKKSSIFLTMLIACLWSCSKDVDLVQTVLLEPTSVELVFPEENEVCTTGTVVSEIESEVVFDWTDADITDGYIIIMTNLETGVEERYEAEDSEMPIRILRGTPYRWRVDTFLTDSGVVVQSSSEDFYNAGPGEQSFIPFPANAIFPKNGELVNSTSTITLQWETSDVDNDITEYDIYFGLDSDPPLFSESVEENSLANVGIVAGTTYYWKVVTKDALGNESTSQEFSFETTN